ncbi:hypothetical protein G6F62_014078 [Rhizopus arrhizus]|nr:hypothetical protein G6F62_014078 [Rhizopus arrhizus]
MIVSSVVEIPVLLVVVTAESVAFPLPLSLFSVTTGWKSPSELSSTPTDVDNTVSRPIRIKPESKPSEVPSITPTPTEASSSSFEDNAQKEADV